MGSEQNNTSMPFSEPKLCANNCGFWGNSTTMNLCSKCYRDVSLKEQMTAAAKVAVETSFLNVNRPAISTDSGVEVASGNASIAATEDPPKPKAAAKNRCGACNRKVGLTGFKCKCGNMFCGDHRYAESHECSFDYKSAGRDAISKANPVVKADKIERF